MMDGFLNTAGTFLAGDAVTVVYWCMAAGGSVFFLLILAANGLEGFSDAPDGVGEHIDTGFEDFQFISLKTILAFVTIFGWSGVVWGRNGITGFLAALFFGLVAMSLTALVVWALLKLQHSGTIPPAEYIGKTGTVYLSIPGKRAGQGKVTVALEGSTAEISAVADEPLATGTSVRILEHVDAALYVVGKI